MMQTGRKAEIEIERTVFDQYTGGIAARLALERRDLRNDLRERRLRFMAEEGDAERWEVGQLRAGVERDYSASRIPMQRF